MFLLKLVQATGNVIFFIILFYIMEETFYQTRINLNHFHFERRLLSSVGAGDERELRHDYIMKHTNFL